MWKDHDIILREDGSFVIVKNGNAYHVPNKGEFTTEWEEVFAYTEARPGQVTPEVKPPMPSLDEARAAKLGEILGGANAMSATSKTKYSQPEINSWQQQEAEARALLDNADSPAPLVRDLAANDGVSPLEFSKRIVANAELAAVVGMSIILQQQAMEKAVTAAQSIEAVQAISVNYTA